MHKPFGAFGISAILCLCFLSAYTGYAQGGGLDLDRFGSSSRQQTGSTSLLTAEQIPSDDPIDPTLYHLGPGDILSYQSTGLDFSEKLVVVTPENTILMERIGLIKVEGLTLASLRDTLNSVMKRRSATVELHITLRRPRLVYVTLRGNVSFPGTYAVPASMRVGTFLTLMRQPWLLSKDAGLAEMARTGGANNVPTKAQELTRTSGYQLGPYALRNIAVLHRAHTSVADIPKSRVDGFGYLNPHVREGDEIVVPFEDREVSTISIAGAVVVAQTLSYKVGDRASLLLTAAGGPTEEADINKVYLVQVDGGGKKQLHVDSNFRIVGEDPELQPGSTIIVERKAGVETSRVQGVVQVYGEVLSPGAAVIVPGKTRLSDVIRMTGGLTKNASASLSYVVRPERTALTMVQQRDDAFRLFQYSDLMLEDTIRYNIDQKYRIPYVSCDIEKALKDTNSSQNIVLQSGDLVVIQATPDRIFVYGQVVRPGYVQFVPGKRLQWYVDQAGGYATGAEDDRARIIRGRSKVWLADDSDVFVEPGDEIYVPRPPDVPYGTQIQTYAIAASIITSVVAITATVISLLR